jgi:N-acetylglucosamine-6-sulfatase
VSHRLIVAAALEADRWPSYGRRVLPGVGRFLVPALAWLALAAPAAAAQPNIVLIVTDDQRWDTLASMPVVQTELAGRGVTFANGFVTNPLCCPSRASILTGAYSHTTRVYRNADPLGGFGALSDGSTVATWLDDAGYDTAFLGKYINQYPGSYVPPGWDHWTSFWSDGYYTYGLTVDGVDFPRAEQTYSTDFLAQEAVSFIRSSPGPFFLYFAPYAPHSGAVPAERHAASFSELPAWRPPSFNEREVADKPRWVRRLPRLDAARRAALDAFRLDQLRTLLAVDEAVAAILEALSERGELDNTLIVFTSDNGYLWGEHRVTRKKVAYEEAIHVPFVVRYDAIVDAGRTETRPVLNIDLAPTFAALAGAAAPGVEGRSIVPLLAGEDVPWRSGFLVESYDKRPPTYCALRTRRYAFVTYATAERELYDLVVDPYQLRNVAGERARKIASSRRQLARLCNPPPPGLSRKLLCTHAGTHRGDVLTGSPRYDIVCARGGGDRIDARGGSDYVFAGGGNDRVYARDGKADVIACGPGRDVAFADAADRVRADCERVARG